MAILDVRPLLAAGLEPYALIMKAVADLASGEQLEIVAPMEPVPLYRIMEAKGFEHTTRRAADGAWHVAFSRAEEETSQ